MIFNRIDFNEDWVKTKTLPDFIAHEKHHGLSDEQMKEVFELIVPKVEIEKPIKNVDDSSLIGKDAEFEH